MTYQDVMNFLVENRPSGLNPQVFSELFDRMIWSSSDNGYVICETRRKWLQGDDRFKVGVSLLMSEVFPYESHDEMDTAFSKIERKWPDLVAYCEKWRSRWSAQKRP